MIGEQFSSEAERRAYRLGYRQAFREVAAIFLAALAVTCAAAVIATWTWG